MAKVADAKTATTGSFFKVAEDGYTGTTASWGTEILNANCGKRAFTVPKNIAAGNYLVRAEAIALHAGAGNPQPYVSCFQVKVTGGGSANPTGVSFPGAYKITYVKAFGLFMFLVLTSTVTRSSPRLSTTRLSSTSVPARLFTLVSSAPWSYSNRYQLVHILALNIETFTMDTSGDSLCFSSLAKSCLHSSFSRT
jgi:hypothetical protein